jgi:hypothetical protein
MQTPVEPFPWYCEIMHESNAKVEEVTVKPLADLIAASAATPQFKDAVQALAAGRPQRVIDYNPGSPPVKVLRLVAKLLEAYPEYAFERLEVLGESSCSGFWGRAIAEPGPAEFQYEWDCAWRAEERGWFDSFGDPDQIRAARTLGYQCFRRLERV